VRRWNEVHFEEKAKTILDVVRVDDPKYDKPLMIATTARELTTEEFLSGYKMPLLYSIPSPKGIFAKSDYCILC
jgi:hypothetical protein